VHVHHHNATCSYVVDHQASLHDILGPLSVSISSAVTWDWRFTQRTIPVIISTPSPSLHLHQPERAGMCAGCRWSFGCHGNGCERVRWSFTAALTRTSASGVWSSQITAAKSGCSPASVALLATRQCRLTVAGERHNARRVVSHRRGVLRCVWEIGPSLMSHKTAIHKYGGLILVFVDLSFFWVWYCYYIV